MVIFWAFWCHIGLIRYADVLDYGLVFDAWSLSQFTMEIWVGWNSLGGRRGNRKVPLLAPHVQ